MAGTGRRAENGAARHAPRGTVRSAQSEAAAAYSGGICDSRVFFKRLQTERTQLQARSVTRIASSPKQMRGVPSRAVRTSERDAYPQLQRTAVSARQRRLL